MTASEEGAQAQNRSIPEASNRQPPYTQQMDACACPPTQTPLTIATAPRQKKSPPAFFVEVALRKPRCAGSAENLPVSDNLCFKPHPPAVSLEKMVLVFDINRARIWTVSGSGQSVHR